MTAWDKLAAWAARIRKALVAVGGALTIAAAELAAAADLVSPTAARWVALVGAVCTAVGVYQVPNRAPAGAGLWVDGDAATAERRGRHARQE